MKLDDIERGVGRQIDQAEKEGLFDNLPGKGKPLKLNPDQHVDPGARAAYQLLKDNDLTLPWIEKGRQIDKALAQARSRLKMSWDLLQDADAGDNWPSSEWERAKMQFRERLAALNKVIREYNLEIPNPRFERFVLNEDQEIERIIREADGL